MKAYRWLFLMVAIDIGFSIYSLIKQKQMADKFKVLEDAVAQESSVIDSAVSLLNGIASAITDAKDDPVKIQALADDITAKSNLLAAAVAANTPAAEPVADPVTDTTTDSTAPDVSA